MSNTSTNEDTTIKVALRIRPLTSEDLINIPIRFQRNILSTAAYAPNQVSIQHEKKHNFSFDYVFRQECNQKEVYERCVTKMVDKFLDGFNVTILAYGQTSSGKTHTMGTSNDITFPTESRGIIPRAMDTLFSAVNSARYKSQKFSMRVSFVELYNEDLIDLLAECNDEDKPQVLIRENSNGSISLSGLQEIKVNSVDEVMGHLSRGSLNRQVGATDMNSKSSRSHAIFTVILSQQKFIPSNELCASPLPLTPSTSSTPTSFPETKSGSLSRSNSRLSRRFEDGTWLKRTSTNEERIKEGISINSGLLALGNVISALGDPTKAKNTTHIPYRDSKLTRLLQDSLGGNALTLMIACVSPAEYNAAETLNTLKYANRARNIKNSAIIMQEEAGWNDLEHLQNLVLKLRSEIKNLKTLSVSNENINIQYNGSETPDSQIPSSLHIDTDVKTDKVSQNCNDIEVLEEQLAELQRSYNELSQNFSKKSSELEMYQNFSDIKTISSLTTIKEEDEVIFNKPHLSEDFQKTVKPVIMEYEKSISVLESQLALARAALNHTEVSMLEQEAKLADAEKFREESKSLIDDLKYKVSKLNERETTTENYIQDLEAKLKIHSSEYKKDQETISDLRRQLMELRENGDNNEDLISQLETRLAARESKLELMSSNQEKLEKALSQQKDAYSKLEEKYTQEKLKNEEDKKMLMTGIEERDRRISSLEKKVEELVDEISQLKRLRMDMKNVSNRDYRSNSLASASSTSSDQDTPLSTPPDSNTPKSSVNYSSILGLESKLYQLQKTHEKTISEYSDIKNKYALCLEEIQELQEKLQGVKVKVNIIPGTPLTPTEISLNELIDIDSKSLSPSTHGTHRKAKSLSAEIKGLEKRDNSSASMVQKLQIELKQLQSLHEDKDQGLDAVKKEFARLEICHREALEIVEELREEIKRRDALAQMEVMSVMGSEYTLNEYSTATSEIDQYEIVQRLREEVEQLKEEQRRTLESISEREEDGNNEFMELESTIEELKSEMQRLLEEQALKDSEVSGAVPDNNYDQVREMQLTIKSLEEQLSEAKRQIYIADAASRLEGNNKIESDVENLELRQQVEKLQNEIESKSHTIAALLFPSIEHQNTIRRLEDELEKVREAHQQAILEKSSQLTSISEEFEGKEIDGMDSFAREQAYDKHVQTLEEKVKELELQLNKAREAQHVPTPRASIHFDIDPTRMNINDLEEKLATLQHELVLKSKTVESLNGEQEIVAELQEKLLILKSDIQNKYELIEVLKRDLADKSMLQQKLREKEAEALIFKTKLMEVNKKEQEMEDEIKKLKEQLNRLESGDDVNEVLQEELNRLKKEIIEVREKESIALERFRVLKAKLGSDPEENHLQDELERLRIVEITQRERIAVLENTLSEQGGHVECDIAQLQNDLLLAKESEATQKNIIESLEAKLRKAEDKSQISAVRREINESKIKETEYLKRIKELELQFNEHNTKDQNEISKLNEELEKMRSLEREQRKQIETLETRLELVSDEDPNISSLRDQIAKLKASESDMRRTVQDYESKLITAQKEVKIFDTVKEEVKFLKELEAEQKSTIEQLQAQLQKLRTSKEAAVDELQTMKGGFVIQKDLAISLENEVNSLREKLAAIKNNDVRSSQDLEEMTNLISKTQKERDDAQKAVKALEIELETFKLAGVAGNENVGALRSELANAKLEMAAQNEILADLDSQIGIMDKERSQNIQRIQELTEALKERESNQKDAIKNLECTLMNLSSELVVAKDSSNISKKTIVTLEEKISIVRSQLHDAKASDERRSNIINELENKLKSTLNILTDKEENITNFDVLISGLETIIQKTQLELQTSKASEEDVSKRRNELEAKLAEVTSKLQDTNNDKNDLQQDVKMFNEELAKIKASEIKHIEQVKLLETKLKEVEAYRAEETSKLEKANKEIESLNDKCDQLQQELEDAQWDSVIQSYENVDDTMIEDLTNQLKQVHNEAKFHRDQVIALEKKAKQLESDKAENLDRNAILEQQVEQLQKDFEILSEEFSQTTSKFEETNALSKQQKQRIIELETTLEETKKASFIADRNSTRISASTNPALAELASANENLRQINDSLNIKISKAEERVSELNAKINILEDELAKFRSGSININEESVESLKLKIQELQSDKDVLEQANEAAYGERSKLDHKIEILMQQLRSVGGNKAAQHISQLNEQIAKLEKEHAQLKQDSLDEIRDMEKEIEHLIEHNSCLEQEIKEMGGNIPNIDKVSSPAPTMQRPSRDGPMHAKISRQDDTITQQNLLIKTLQEKITELESRSYDEPNSNVGPELDAVGGVRLSTTSSSSNSSDANNKKGQRHPSLTKPPPVPPPNQPLPPIPQNSMSRARSSRSDSVASSDLSSEIQRLHKKISEIEGENLQSRHLVQTLQTSVSDHETNLRVAKQQLSILQREKMEYLDQIKNLRENLVEATDQIEKAKSTVQEEKKVMENVLEEERRAKERAEKARVQLESQMEQLMSRKSKFMCF
ncbi:1610_t:CDS:2 [Dentiscutata erythropus]|uniref:1610_t:CDS:1 n=1 Tax=Dentiscutata erythropus TaxID=1348616 RepID=A0A9N8Z4A2_9GLOM|nr:1610_t:CDS:2 [Dentiscutata erythropus]